MPTPDSTPNRILQKVESLGRSMTRWVDSIGFGASLLYQVGFWVLMGRQRNQPVRAAPIFSQMMEVGIRALPIVTILSFTIGLMLAIQGIDALKTFGAEHQVTFGVVLSVTRRR